LGRGLRNALHYKCLNIKSCNDFMKRDEVAHWAKDPHFHMVLNGN